MNYPFDQKDVIHLWLPVFLAISIEFWGYEADLHFPLEISEELRQVAKEFCLLSLSAIGISVPEAPPTITTPTSSTETDSLFPAWEYTFSRLEMMGYAQAIYGWGQQIQHDNAQFFDRLDGGTSFLLTHWSLDLVELRFSPLELDHETVQTIQLIVLRHHAKSIYARYKIQQLELRPQYLDAWERFALLNEGISSWLINELHLQSRLSQWREILHHLTEEKIQILDVWYAQNVNPHYSSDSFSLIELAKELS